VELFVDNFDRPGKHLEKYPEVAEIFKQPRCHWFAPPPNKRIRHIEHSVRRLMMRAHPNIIGCVIYNIPDRDCGNYSKGGAVDNSHYLKYIEQFAKGIQGYNPIVIFEPDALPLAVGEWDKPPTQQLLDRIALYNQCIPLLRNAGAKVYVDIGHPRWLSPEKAAEVLGRLNCMFDGFSTNVSNFVPLDECIEWGSKVSALMNGLHFVIDTSRNGAQDYSGDWCNPPGRRLGHLPTLKTGYQSVDAFLWVKVPGESDGTGNGGPNAGQFWPEYAMTLLGK